MNSAQQLLLVLDALVNLVLGLVLLLVPAGTLHLLGLPTPSTYFYPTLLGGVLFGIGAALFLEFWGASRGLRGLGLGGAIAINLCGASVLIFWLVFGGLDLTSRGQIVLWIVAVSVLGIGAAEAATRSWRTEDNMR